MQPANLFVVRFFPFDYQIIAYSERGYASLLLGHIPSHFKVITCAIMAEHEIDWLEGRSEHILTLET